MIDSTPAVPHGERIYSDEQTLHLALVLWADGRPFSVADLDWVLTATGQSWTWLLARLGERVVTGLLAYDTATGYRVIDPSALEALLQASWSTAPGSATPPKLGLTGLYELAQQARHDTVAGDGAPAVQPAVAPDRIHPMVAAAGARPCPACGDPAQIRKAARARTAFGLAMLALFAAATLAAPAALTIALIVVFAATGIRFIRLVPAPCRHRL